MAIWVGRADYCLYCGDPAVEKEHLFPNSAIKRLDVAGVMQYEFLAPTCYRCNRIASTNIFSTVGEKIDFVQARLRKIGVWPLPVIPERIRNVSIVGRGYWDDREGSAPISTETNTGQSVGRSGYKPSTHHPPLSAIAPECERCGRLFLPSGKGMRRRFCKLCAKAAKKFSNVTYGRI